MRFARRHTYQWRLKKPVGIGFGAENGNVASYPPDSRRGFLLSWEPQFSNRQSRSLDCRREIIE